MPEGEGNEKRIEPCGCGLWICRECRPENFDSDHPLNGVDVEARIKALERAASDPNYQEERR